MSRKKLACIGCGCSVFIYLLLMRNVAPRLLVRQTSHTGHDSNRLDEHRELISELILRKQPHLHRQQDGIGEITEQDNGNIHHGQPPLHQQKQELERNEQKRYNEEQEGPQQDLHLRNDPQEVQLQQHAISTILQHVTGNAGSPKTPHLANIVEQLDSRHKGDELSWINKAMKLKSKVGFGQPKTN